MEFMQASTQWRNRPPEERFTSLTAMHSALAAVRADSRSVVVSSRTLRAVPAPDNGIDGLLIEGPNGHGLAPSNFAIGQAASLVGAPVGYLRTLPAPIVADLLNYGLTVERQAEDVQVLATRGRDSQPGTIRAMTGPRYGRVWNSDVIASLIARFGDGVTGNFRVPGIFGRPLDQVTADVTTLYAGDRDCFVFLADEENRIELPNRRDGQAGSLARGFFVSNSEVGAGTLRVRTFLFDYVCSNRIVWGARDVAEIAIRHTAAAPQRFVEEVAPALMTYANSSARGIEATLHNAQAARLDNVREFLAKRFGPKIGERVAAAHVADEGRPVETMWDAVTAATAYARSIPWAAERVEFETQAGDLLDLVAA